KHAAELDLIAYEDPIFYDRLERARVQATDRLGMIQQIGSLIQQMVTAVSLSVYIIAYSPWLLLLLVAGILPAFLGESHFAFLGYAKNFRQTPIRRQLGGGKRTEAIRSEGLSRRPLYSPMGPDLRRECRPLPPPPHRRSAALAAGHGGLLL